MFRLIHRTYMFMCTMHYTHTLPTRKSTANPSTIKNAHTEDTLIVITVHPPPSLPSSGPQRAQGRKGEGERIRVHIFIYAAFLQEIQYPFPDEVPLDFPPAHNSTTFIIRDERAVLHQLARIQPSTFFLSFLSATSPAFS